MSDSNNWRPFVRENRSFLRVVRVLLSILMLGPLFSIWVTWGGGSPDGFGVFSLLAGLFVIGWLSYLLRKY